MYDLVVKNGKLVTPDRIYEADIAVKDGVYSAFLAKGTEAAAKKVIDAKGCYVFPGIIDCSKTCAYVWTVLIGYSAMKQACR